MEYGYDDGVDILELFRLWNTDTTTEEIQAELGISRSKLYQLAAKHKLRRRPSIKEESTERQPKDPTEEEILARAAEVRKRWSPQDHEKRRVSKTQSVWCVPTYTYEPKQDRFTERNP